MFSALWLVMLVAFPQALSVFRDFKVEMPALTVLWLNFYRIGGWALVGACVVASAILLSLRTRIGWWLTFGLSGLLDFFCLSLVLPLIAIYNTLSGGDALLPLLVISTPPVIPAWLMIVALVNQGVKATLLLNQRHFFTR